MICRWHIILILISKYTMILGQSQDDLAIYFVKKIVAQIIIELTEVVRSTATNKNICQLNILTNELTKGTINKITSYISNGVLGFEPLQKDIVELLLSALIILKPDKQLIKPFTSYEQRKMEGFWDDDIKIVTAGIEVPDYAKADLFWRRRMIEFFQYAFKKIP